MDPNRPASASGSGATDGHPPPPLSRYFQTGPSRSAFAHHLPPPIPSQPSPRNSHFYPPSPGSRDVSAMGHTDPASWASERPTSNRSSNRWSPTLPALALSPRHPGLEPVPGQADSQSFRQGLQQLGNGQTHHHRLPPLSDYPQRPTSGWGDPPSTGHSSITSRPPTSYETFRPSSSHFQPHPPQLSLHPSRSFPPLQTDTARDRRASDIQSYSPLVGSPDPSLIRGVPESPPGESGKKKKRRVALSCAECAKRKQKCNRETPCQHCVSRRVPELCVPYAKNTSPGARTTTVDRRESAREVKVERDTDGGTPVLGAAEVAASTAPQAQAMVASTSGPRVGVLPTLSIRVMRLEAMVNTMINQVPGLDGKALQDWRINHPPAPPPSGEVVARQRGSSVVSSRTRPDTGDTVREREASVGNEIGLLTGIDVESSTRNPLPQSMLDATDPVPLGLDSHYSPEQHLQVIFNNCGVASHKIQDLMSELPSRADADDLVKWFFTKINYVRYPISEHLFKQGFAMLYDNRSITAEAVLALPLVFIVLAMAIRVAPDEWVGAEDVKRATSLRMYWNSRAAITLAAAVKGETLQLVETRICTGLYLVLMHERRLAEGWAEFRAGISTGQAIGLHRDGSKLGLDGYSTEYRRRIWSYLIHADATYSCLLGRPISIDLRFCDTLPPSNLNMDKFQSETIAPLAKPLSEPTYATYLILRRSLGEIMAKVTQHFQRLDGVGEYKDVEGLNGELCALRDGLPEVFRMLTPVKDWDDKCWYLPVHRYYIQTEILHFIIILHRPWLLRRLKSDRYQLSRQACFEAAVTDYKIRQAWKKDCPEFFETLLGSSFREFNVAMIAGISLIVDPRGPHAVDMGQIVQAFMQDHPHNPRADDFSQKEAAIIHTLHRRAQEMEERRTLRHSRVRPNLSNERGQHISPSAPLDGSTRNGADHGNPGGTTHPSGLLHRSSLASGTSDSTDYGQNHFNGNRQLGSSSEALAGNGNVEEEEPQKLLDRWLMSHVNFGPGADATINPFVATYAGVPPLYNAYGQSQSFAAQPSTGQYLSTTQDPPSHTNDRSSVPSATHHEAGSGVVGLGIESGAPDLSGGEPMGRVRSLVGPPREDGNPTVFWDRLIDGIVVGQGYDLMGVPSM